MPESTLQAELTTFEIGGIAELVFLLGDHSLVPVLLNAFDISTLRREEGLACRW